MQPTMGYEFGETGLAKLIQERLLTAQSRQKSCAYWKVRDLEVMEGEGILLKVLPMNSVLHFFEKKGKLSLRFIAPFRGSTVDLAKH